LTRILDISRLFCPDFNGPDNAPRLASTDSMSCLRAEQLQADIQDVGNAVAFFVGDVSEALIGNIEGTPRRQTRADSSYERRCLLARPPSW
jgi:hypothetical protein